MKNDNLKDKIEFNTITKRDLLDKILKNEKFILIDVRDTPDYKK